MKAFAIFFYLSSVPFKKGASGFFAFLLLQLFIIQGQGQDKVFIDSISDQAHFKYSDYDYPEAIRLAQEALSLSQTEDYPEGILRSQLYLLMASQESSKEIYDPKAVEILIPQLVVKGLWLEQARALSFLANTYAFFGDVEKSIQNHLKALAIYEEHELITGMASVYNSLGLIYYDQHDFDEAFFYIRKSLAMEEGVGDLKRVHTSLNNLAIIFEYTGPIDSAIFYHKQALDIAYQTKNPYSIGLSLSNLGNNYANDGQLDLAESTLLEALKIRDSLGYSRGLAYTHNRLANLYLEKNEFQKSQFHAQKSLENAELASELKVIRMAYERMMELAEKTGNTAQELKYLKLATELKDSLLNDSNTKEITQMMANYDFEKRQMLDSIQNAQVMREQSLLYEERLKVERNRQIIFLISGILLLVLAVSWWRRYIFIRKSNFAIAAEKERSDDLLLNILPENVAQELKEKGYSDARDFEKVTVIFTDFADFTKKAQYLSAKELVNELNTCFKEFDKIVESKGLEKIKTIGDAYMVAAGLDSKSDALSAVEAALEMKEFILERNQNPSIPIKAKFDMRVGINSGSVVAGIVGIKKFQYDIWGDTVNTAQRMESNCELNRINISENTYELVKNEPRFEFDYRGEIEVKGKGLMKMWFIMRSKTS